MTQNEWKPVGGRDLEDGAWEAIRQPGCVLVTAGPGAGKTEMMAQKACFLLQTGTCSYPQRILAVSFKRDAATGLEERVNSRCGNLARRSFSSLTFDAFAKSILDRFRLALPVEIRPTAQYSLCAPYEDPFIQKLAKKHYPYKKKQLDALEEGVVSKINDCTKDIVLDTLLQGDENHGSHLTYKMVFALAGMILKRNPMIVRAIRMTFTHVFLDEFQDITEPQYNMVRFLFRNTASITAVGDDKQRIMVWAGAKKDSFECFEKDYESKPIELYMNHRSAPRLVHLQKMMYESLGRTGDPATPSDAWREDQGEVRLIKSRNDLDEAAWLANDIERLLKEEVLAGEICVLVKQKVSDYTKSLAKELDKRGIRSLDMSDSYVDTVSSDRFLEFLLCFAAIALGSNDSDCWREVRETLSVLLGFYNDERFSDLDRHEKEFEAKKDALGKQLSTAIDKQGIKNAFGELCYEWIGVENISSFSSLYTTESLEERLAILSEALYLRMKRWDSIRESVQMLLGKNVVRFMTIHKSKGMEFEYVYLMGLEDAAFWKMDKNPEEERRAFFVALSRAKKSIAFTACVNRAMPRNGKLESEKQEFNKVAEFYNIIKASGFAVTVDNIANSPTRC